MRVEELVQVLTEHPGFGQDLRYNTQVPTSLAGGGATGLESL